MTNKQQKKRSEAPGGDGSRGRNLHLAFLLLPAVLAMSVLYPAPAHAGFFGDAAVGMGKTLYGVGKALFGSDDNKNPYLQKDVICGTGLHLQRASKLGAVQSYVFGGECALMDDYQAGPVVVDHPPLSATARWDKTSSTYTETLRLLAADVDWHVGTGPEKASFKCDVDPVINRTAHCILITQHNATGWGGQRDGFAWQAVNNLPLLLGRATAGQATSVSRDTTAQINCSGLHLADATGVPKDRNSWYRFEGTCRLYHTKSGSQGLQVTRVEVFGDWDATDMQTHEGVSVTADSSEGGGMWRTTYTCDKDPWIHRDAQCSRTMKSRAAAPPVYDPITDLIARHPVALGMANAKQAVKLSRAHHASGPRHAAKKPVAPPRIYRAGHKGMVLSRSSHLPSLPKPPLRPIGHKSMVLSGLSHASLAKPKPPVLSRSSHVTSLPNKPKLTIRYAIASSTNKCDPNSLLKVNVEILNKGAPLFARTRFAYVHAAESGGAHLTTSHNVSLPAISAQKAWSGTLVVGTRKLFFPKLPGQHTLLVSIGPDNAAPGTLGYIPPLPSRVPVIFPAGYCRQSQYRGIGALMRGATRGAIHGTTRRKPAVSLRHATQQRGVRKKLTPVTPVHRLNRPMRQLPKSKATAGPRHATQQRSVRKKLTPMTPVLRFAPVTPVHHLNLPARPGLNQ